MPAVPPADRPLVVHVDVTDTVATHWRAGIQRVVAQLVAQLGHDARLEVVPVVWLESVAGFRRLTADEARRLAPHVASGPAAEPAAEATRSTVRAAWARLRPLLGAVRRAVVAVLVALRLEPLLRRARRAVLARTRDRELVPLTQHLGPGSVLFELDTVWNNTWVDRGELYAELRSQGVHVAVLVYDLLPQQHPEWFEPSLVVVSDRTIAAQAAHADAVLAISAHTAASFVDWARRRGLQPPAPVVVDLGADAAAATRDAVGPPPDELAGVDYALAVGTVEPRKNHATLLDAFELLWPSHPDAHLVVVGRPGWHNDEVLERLDTHPELGRRLHWYRGAGDDQLAALYSHARMVAVPSITEGYGLPVIEALSHGVPVIASDGGALVEAGGDLVEHVAATDASAWAAALRAMFDDDDLVGARRAALAGYRAPRWADTGTQVADLLVGRFGGASGPAPGGGSFSPGA